MGSGLKVLKDLNFIELEENMDINQDEKLDLYNVLFSDSKFLAQNNLMDYSLLFVKVSMQDSPKKKPKQMPAI